jgi:glucose-6-phosphate 1-dehydrogenase
VPFYIRAGKRLRSKVTEVAIQFKQPPLALFRHAYDYCDVENAGGNQLVFRIQPREGIELNFAAKQPGFSVNLQNVRMDFSPGEMAASSSPEAYERLIVDALRGDDTLYIRSEEANLSWEFFDPILKAWSETTDPLPKYAAFSWGPGEAESLIAGHHCGWRRPKPGK